MSDTAAYLKKLDEAADSIRGHLGEVPSILVVAGSGLGTFADTLGDAKAVPYGSIKHFPVSTVVGHAGKLVKGTCGGKTILVMNGRKHLYEGVDPLEATLPLRALLRAGVKTAIISNAAGGLSPRLAVGDLMLITDHVNMMFRNPLIGPNLDAMGPRFPDMSEPYSRALQAIAREVALAQAIPLREGVYIGLLGPSYETKAEVQMFRTIGDAVGMSTVPETICAVHAGAKVLGISLITNSHVLAAGAVTSHEEVIDEGKKAAAKFSKLVAGVVEKIGD